MTTNKQEEVTVIIVRSNIGYNMYFLTKDEECYGGVGLTEYDAKYMSDKLNIEIKDWRTNKE